MSMQKIDFIIPWVDDGDKQWIKERGDSFLALHPDTEANSNIRFENWENLQYWFRAIETYMPWYHRIFLVTCGHCPDFLKIDHPKLRIISHKDYMPKEYLPTFNSNAIELNYHRIEELSENFILFNDDTFPLQPIEETYYFRDNCVCDEAVEGPVSPVDTGLVAHMGRYVQVNNMIIINRHFRKRKVQEDNWDKWYCQGYGELLERTKSLSYWYDFVGFRDPHMPNGLKKSTLEHLWNIEYKALHTTSLNQFRSYNDVSQYLIRYWQLCTGNFIPRRTLGKFFAVDIRNYQKIAEEIENRKWQMVSLNEACNPEDFQIIKKEINNKLERIFPEKSSFER